MLASRAHAAGPGADRTRRFDTGDIFVMRNAGTSFVFDNGSPWVTGLTSANFDIVVRNIRGADKAALVSRDRTTGIVSARHVNGANTGFSAANQWLTGIFSQQIFVESCPQSIYN